MATVDMVDLGDHVEIMAWSQRFSHAERLILRSSEPEAGSDYENGYWPPETDSRWMPERPHSWGGEIVSNNAGKGWRASVGAVTPDGSNFYSTEDDYFGTIPGFAGMWNLLNGDVDVFRSQLEANNAGATAIDLSVMWFDCSGLPPGPYGRIEFVAHADRIRDPDGRSVTCDVVTGFDTFDQGDDEPYMFPADYTSSDAAGTALVPGSETLAALDEGGSSELLDDLNTTVFENWVAWPVSQDVRNRVLSGGRFGIRTRIIPAAGLKPPPFDDVRFDWQIGSFSVQSWMDDGRPLDQFEGSDDPVPIPRLRLWRDTAAVNVTANLRIPMSMTASLRGPGRRMNEHRARQKRDARR